MSIESIKQALLLAHEGVEIHSPNSPEHKVCAALIALAGIDLESQEIQIDEWNGLTDKQKLVLIRNEPNWTALQLIEEVEVMLKGNNK